MPDDFFFHVKIATVAGVAAAAIVAILFFDPVFDIRFCFPHTCAPTQAAQNDCPDKGDGCEPCRTACTDGKGGEEKEKQDGSESVTTTTENHSIDDHSVTSHSVTIENINIYGSVGRTARKGEDWCPLPPDEGEESECAAGSSGAKELFGEVYFENDSADLSEESRCKLDGIVEKIEDRLREQSGDVIVLEAYASYPGPAVYNLNLAEERIQSVAGHIGGKIDRATWKFRQVIHGESHIYRDTGETSDCEGDPKNRVVRIFACSDPCCDMEQEAVSNPDPQACTKAGG